MGPTAFGTRGDELGTNPAGTADDEATHEVHPCCRKVSPGESFAQHKKGTQSNGAGQPMMLEFRLQAIFPLEYKSRSTWMQLGRILAARS